MTDKKSNSIHKLFIGLQSQMEAQLTTNRAVIPHAPSKGAALENVWIEWLRKYLPNRYNVDSAFVIDSEGNLSEQIDLVIYDQQYTPFIFIQDGVKYVPAEGVYAVFEVKPDLDGPVKSGGESMNYIQYAGKKVASVRRLKRTSAQIIDRGFSKPPRSLTKIIGGILTNENSIVKKKTIEKHLKSILGIGSLDMGCCVGYGSFIIEYDTKEDLAIEDFNNRIHSYYDSRQIESVDFVSKDKALVSFFLQLSRYLQQSIGTVAAIDFAAYAEVLNFKIDPEL